MRRAVMEDAELLFIWVNEQSVRANSFSQEPVLWQDHLDWFKKRLVSETCFILILEQAGVPVGQLRFDLNNDSAWEIDYSVAIEHRGMGFGKKVISRGVEFLRKSGRIEQILAKVKVSNPGSARVFRTQGFQEQIINEMHVFTLSCNT